MAERSNGYHPSMGGAGSRSVTSRRCRGEYVMSAIRPTTVEVETSLRLVAPDATTLPVRASLRYDPADPYAVHVLFHAEGGFRRACAVLAGRSLAVRGTPQCAGAFRAAHVRGGAA